MEWQKLVTSSTNKMICCVCGGIGEYFNVDPTLVRLLWVILTIGGFGVGLLIYILAAVIMPQDY